VSAKRKATLRWAAQLGDRARLTELLAAGADPNEIDGTTTPLAMACFHRKVPIVRALLEAGASPSLCVPGGSPPLLDAVQSKSKRTTEMVQMLLAAGAEPNPMAYRGMTLIEWCARDGKLAEVKALLEAAVAATRPTPAPPRRRAPAPARAAPRAGRAKPKSRAPRR
jgi:ankyrin repeat protein